MKWSSTNYPRQYTVWIWNDSTNSWKSVKTVSSDGNSDTIKFSTPVKARIFSLNLASPNSSYYVLYDWKVMGH